MKRLQLCHPSGFITVGVTAAVIGLQVLGALQFLEWTLLNHWFRLRPAESRPVPLVLVTISESDIQQAGRWPLADAQLAALLNRLKRGRPIAIGLDLYRDLPIEPGHADLLKVFETTPNLIGITKAIGNGVAPAVPPPPILGDREQIGVNDLLLDADGIIRRNLLSVQQRGKDVPSLGAKLALMYLHQQGITPERKVNDPCLYLGKAKFCRLDQNAGGYIQVDAGGYQTLSNFLQISGNIPSVTFTDVMAGRVPDSRLQDKIVLVGAKADSLWGDRFYTPYTTDSTSTWAGVEIHANVAAQMISSALGGRPLLQGLPQLLGWSWIFLWAGLGAASGWSLRSFGWAIVVVPLLLSSTLAIAYSLFLLGWWAIAVSPVLAFITAELLSRSYQNWQALKQANQFLERKVQERTQELCEKNLALEHAQLSAETANQALQRLAHTDELTQVGNRRSFNEYLEQEWQQMMRTQSPLSLILIDVDFFKSYNDTYGHPAGDECLAKIADVLRSAAKRPANLVARYGGEEFAIILPNTPIAGATEVATNIRSEMQHLKICHRCSQISAYVTVSMGVVCTVPTPSASPAQLVDRVDQALYRAKMEGRDRVISEEFIP